ncbi:radical SAM protein [Candidatus Kaiserbacteria bacterium]|nr:radical SAM protein [Candidatus Kaiserbacteria bacterium]
MDRKVKVLLVARYYIIEPLGLLHLVGLATSLGCEVDVELVPNNDFTGLYRRVEEWKPEYVGFQIWTGWHLQTFAACDRVRSMGPQVIIGGPHVTYFTEECAKHADYVVRGDGFRNFRRILQGEIGCGVHFDTEQLAEKFPLPNRSIVYDKYPVLRDSPIRSMITSVGCPFTCSYCYAPEWNKMYGGFHHTQRSVDDIVREGVEIRDRWGAKMIYLQDDIFGFDYKVWLPEFARRWKEEVGIPFHCQIRLELTRYRAGDERLDLFVEAGCTGITLAIESGDAFLREHVLHREMTDELILDGCDKIRSRGMTLRTEQILAVPFSSLETDLSTLDLNNRIGPEMAWTSILAPYGGTEMGDVAKAFGYYKGDNDDLEEEFFRRSVMRHSKTAKNAIEPVVREMVESNKAMERANRHSKSPLRRLEAREVAPLVMEVSIRDERDEFSRKHLRGPKPLCTIEFMDDEENDRYADQIVILQRLFMWFSLVPVAMDLAQKYVMLPREEWTWKKLGQVASEHFEAIGKGSDAARWVQELIRAFGCCSLDELPDVVRDNPYYFVFFPSSAEFAKHVVESGVVQESAEPGFQFDKIGHVARHWLFARSLYKVEESTKPIAS